MQSQLEATGLGVSSNPNLVKLYTIKLQKIVEQKQLSDTMSEHLKLLNDGCKLSRMNLKAAIAVSKQSGYFEYYDASDEVKSIESGKLLNSLTRRVQKVNAELESINAEIITASIKPESKINEMPLTTMSQWFDTYGRAEGALTKKEDLLTKFSPNSKIYGGTSHHRSFKTTSTGIYLYLF